MAAEANVNRGTVYLHFDAVSAIRHG
ncbi:hypothetical protein AB4124_17935 [Paenibacillus sp. 2KB_20]